MFSLFLVISSISILDKITNVRLLNISFSILLLIIVSTNKSIAEYKLELQDVNNIRVLLFDEIFIKSRNIQLIKDLQENLNSRINVFQLSIEENLVLFIYMHEWDSVLNIIPKMDTFS